MKVGDLVRDVDDEFGIVVKIEQVSDVEGDLLYQVLRTCGGIDDMWPEELEIVSCK